MGSQWYKFEDVQIGDARTSCLRDKVDAVYVLSVDGSPRLNACLERLRMNPLLSVVRIQHNRTFKCCTKPGVTTPDEDLRHAMSNCFRDALMRGKKRVVTLEDDCEFVASCDAVRRAICIFYAMEGGHALQLGSIPMLSTPYGPFMHRVHMGGAMHGMAWTLRGMELFLRRVSSYKGSDFVDTLVTKRLRTFAPRRPLAVQKHPMTENARAWLTGIDFVLHRHVFKSHIDGKFFYTTTHAIAYVGGTRMVGVWLSLILALTLCALIWRPPAEA